MRCRQTREEIAVQVLAGGRHQELDVMSAEHLDRCKDCSAEQRRFTHVVDVLSHVALHLFDHATAPAPHSGPDRRGPSRRPEGPGPGPGHV
ncbi:hypothetical protein ACFV2D_35605 [Streptomyces capillispiralis]|uniref:hypothetical protein n=1 Tax=Streptomyces capillispiralis TaxID=68182 RepID=UPI00367BE306